jgi:hypothetical protein
MNQFMSSISDQNLIDLIDASNGCPTLADSMDKALRAEGELISIDELKRGMEDGTVGFSMALLLNKNGINKLFKKASDMTKYTYSPDGMGLTSVSLKAPTIQLTGCPKDLLTNLMTELSNDPHYKKQIQERNEISCITMDLPINVKVTGWNGEINASVGLPIYDMIKGDNPANAEDYAKGLRTSIFADLKHAQIVDLDLGIAKQYEVVIKSAINIAWQQFVSKEFRNYALFDIAAWNVGDGEIKMIAGAPVVKSESQTVQLGMYSNIVSAKSSKTAIDEAFPSNADIGLNIHPDLIRGLIARMMKEKHIENNVSAENIDFMVTMPNIADEYPETEMLKYDWYNKDPQAWGKYFSLAFRLWNDSKTMTCGYIDLIAGLNADITDSKFTIGIGNVHTGKAAGGLSMVSTFANAVTQSQFFQDVLKYATISFNYNELEVSDSKNNETGDAGMSKTEMGALKFTIDGNGISLFLNFLDLEE